MTVLLLLLAATVQAAESGKPVVREIATPAVLYASAEGLRACMDAMGVEIAARIEGIKKSHSPKAQYMARKAILDRETICARATVLQLKDGMAVEVSSNPGPCAVADADTVTPKLSRVRVSGGKDAGATGCVMDKLLRDVTPF